MIKLIFGALICVLPFTAQAAGNLAINTSIEAISSSSDGSSDNFYLKLTGGSGDCVSGSRFVVFPRDLAPSDDAFNRMYSLAMMAFATKSNKVRIFTSSTETSCGRATFIEITQ